MISKMIKINLASGLEARPVAMLVQVASQHESSIYVVDGTKKVNAKSIMGMMTLGLHVGDEIEVQADGSDAQVAIDKIEAFLSEK